MQVFRDYMGRDVRLTDERLEHIYSRHFYMRGMEYAIAETINNPEVVRVDEDDNEAELFYRWYTIPGWGRGWLLVVVIVKEDDAFIATAYMTGAIR